MKFIIPILVGAIIGYITNWFAIKMLFRPHYEKRFLGLHVPFTPGLIPKEKGRIAKSVGETVGVHLLSPEIITEAVSNDKTNNQVITWVQYNINKLKQNDKSIKTLIISSEDENYNKLLKTIKERITDFIYSQLKKKRFKDGIMKLIEDKVFDKANGDFYKIVKERIELFISNLSSSEEIRVALKESINQKINHLEDDQRILGEVLPENIVNGLREYIDEHDEDIAGLLKNMLKTSSVEIKLKESITEFVSKNVSKAITIFMSPEIIAEKVFNAIEKNIDNPEMNKSIMLIITASFDKLLENKVSDIVLDISPKISDEDILKVSDIILGYISDKENQNKVFYIVEEKVKSSESEIKENLLEIISEKIEIVLNSQKFYDNIDLVVDGILETIINRPVSYILKDIDEATVTSIANFSNVVFHNFAKNKLPYLIEQLNISKVVEDEINRFDVAFAEEVILEIANKELKAITWLGAVLGGIMGMLSPLLQLLY